MERAGKKTEGDERKDVILGQLRKAIEYVERNETDGILIYLANSAPDDKGNEVHVFC
jgi:hypothetical protein